MLISTLAVPAETLRLGVWHEPLSRDGPGLLFRDAYNGSDDLKDFAEHIRAVRPDILVLTKINFDANSLAASAFAELIDHDSYPSVHALRSNEGVQSGGDLNNDGKIGGPDDGHGYGNFPGQGGLAILSRHPLDVTRFQDHKDLLWKDVSGSHIQPSDPGYDVQRLSSGGHWIVPVAVPTVGGKILDLRLLLGHSVPPVFDGPEDRNGRRNLDELRLWNQILGTLKTDAPKAHPVLMATLNLDPDAGDGHREDMSSFLMDSGLADPLPKIPTAIWAQPGPLRVTYLLPSATLPIAHANVWPKLETATHRLITVDIDLLDRAEP